MAELKGMRSDLVIDVCDLRKVEWVSHGLGRWGDITDVLVFSIY